MNSINKRFIVTYVSVLFLLSGIKNEYSYIVYTVESFLTKNVLIKNVFAWSYLSLLVATMIFVLLDDLICTKKHLKLIKRVVFVLFFLVTAFYVITILKGGTGGSDVNVLGVIMFLMFKLPFLFISVAALFENKYIRRIASVLCSISIITGCVFTVRLYMSMQNMSYISSLARELLKALALFFVCNYALRTDTENTKERKLSLMYFTYLISYSVIYFSFFKLLPIFRDLYSIQSYNQIIGMLEYFLLLLLGIAYIVIYCNRYTNRFLDFKVFNLLTVCLFSILKLIRDYKVINIQFLIIDIVYAGAMIAFVVYLLNNTLIIKRAVKYITVITIAVSGVLTLCMSFSFFTFVFYSFSALVVYCGLNTKTLKENVEIYQVALGEADDDKESKDKNNKVYKSINLPFVAGFVSILFLISSITAEFGLRFENIAFILSRNLSLREFVALSHIYLLSVAFLLILVEYMIGVNYRGLVTSIKRVVFALSFLFTVFYIFVVRIPYYKAYIDYGFDGILSFISYVVMVLPYAIVPAAGFFENRFVRRVGCMLCNIFIITGCLFRITTFVTMTVPTLISIFTFFIQAIALFVACNFSLRVDYKREKSKLDFMYITLLLSFNVIFYSIYQLILSYMNFDYINKTPFTYQLSIILGFTPHILLSLSYIFVYINDATNRFKRAKAVSLILLAVFTVFNLFRGLAYINYVRFNLKLGDVVYVAAIIAYVVLMLTNRFKSSKVIKYIVPYSIIVAGIMSLSTAPVSFIRFFAFSALVVYCGLQTKKSCVLENDLYEEAEVVKEETTKDEFVYETNDGMIMIQSTGAVNSFISNDNYKQDVIPETRKDKINFEIRKTRRKTLITIAILVFLAFTILNYYFYIHNLNNIKTECYKISRDIYDEVKFTYIRDKETYTIYDSKDINNWFMSSDDDILSVADSYIIQYVGYIDKSESINIEVSGHVTMSIYPKGKNSVILKYKEKGKLAKYYLLYGKGKDIDFYSYDLFNRLGQGSVKSYLDYEYSEKNKK